MASGTTGQHQGSRRDLQGRWQPGAADRYRRPHAMREWRPASVFGLWPLGGKSFSRTTVVHCPRARRFLNLQGARVVVVLASPRGDAAMTCHAVQMEGQAGVKQDMQLAADVMRRACNAG